MSQYVATLNKNVIVSCLHNVIQWYQMGLYLESEDEEDESTDEDE